MIALGNIELSRWFAAAIGKTGIRLVRGAHGALRPLPIRRILCVFLVEAGRASAIA